MTGESPARAGGSDLAITTSASEPLDVAASVAEDSPGARSRPARWMQVATVAVLVVAVALRFLTRSPLWLDEAQTVDIAQRSLPHLFSALREDGAPPLYYVLLHGWIGLFGTSSFAVRSLSGLLSVAALPVAAVAARRLRVPEGSRWPTVLVLATCPFAVRYATEARMYSLVLLLVLLALIAYERVWSVGGRWPAVAAAIVTGALLLTQYWSLFLLATAGLAAIIAAWRGERRARRLLPPMVVGCVFFLPWLPSFAYQSAHTGAPWGGPPGIDTPWLVLNGWTGSGFSAPLLTGTYYVLVAVAVAGVLELGGRLAFGRPFRRRPLLLVGLGVGTLLVGTLASEAVSSAYAPRYSAIALAPLLLVVAAGFDVLPSRGRTAAIAVVCGLGLLSSALIPDEIRTEAGKVASVLSAAAPGDVVVFCPDQLGPAVHRLVPHDGRQVVYPTFGSPAMVDWVDYAARNKAADPVAFSRRLLQMAKGQTIWLVYAEGYRTLAGACTSVYTALSIARGEPVQALKSDSHDFEHDAVAEFRPR